MVNYKLGIFNKSDVKEINLKEVYDLKGLENLEKKSNIKQTPNKIENQIEPEKIKNSVDESWYQTTLFGDEDLGYQKKLKQMIRNILIFLFTKFLKHATIIMYS